MATLNRSLIATQKADELLFVQMFVSDALQPSSGAQIPSSELYNHARAHWRTRYPKGKEPCDAKLAELFGQVLQNRRLASGRVWLNYRIPYEFDWSGPQEADIKAHTIIQQAKTIDVAALGPAVRNIKITPLDGHLPNAILTFQHGRSDYQLHRNGSSFYSAPGLWMLTGVRQNNLILKTFGAETPSCRISYEWAPAPAVCNFSNTVTHDGETITFTHSNSSDSTFQTTGARSNPTFQKMVYDEPALNENPVLFGFRGAAVPRDLATIREPNIFANGNGAAMILISHSELDYSTEVYNIGAPWLYLDQVADTDRYYHCARWALSRGADWIDAFEYVGSLLPAGILEFAIVIGSERIPYHIGDTLVLNLFASRLADKHVYFEIRTSFSTPITSSWNEHVLSNVGVAARHYYFRTEPRLRLPYLDTNFRDVDRAFAMLALATATKDITD